MATRIGRRGTDERLLEGGGGGGGISGTRYSNLPSLRGRANTLDDLRKITTDTSRLKGAAKAASDEAIGRAAVRTGVRAAGATAAGMGVKEALKKDAPANRSDDDIYEDNIQEMQRYMREGARKEREKKTGESEDNYKKGGKIKQMSKSGSASARSDGICSKGKTKGKLI